MKNINQTGPIVLNNDNLFCFGNGVDHDPYNYYATFFAKCDLYGNLIERHLEINNDTGFYFHNYNNDLFINNDSVIIAMDFNGKNFNGGYLFIYNILNGEIIKRIKFESQVDNFAYYKGMAKINDTIYAVLSSVNENNDKHKLNSQISLINIRSGSVKYVVFGRDGVSDTPFCIIWNGKNF